MTTTSQWGADIRRVGVDPVGREALRALIDGDIGVLVLRGLLPAAAFDRHRERAATLYEHAATTYYANGKLTTIGPYLAKHLDDPDRYFAEAERMNALCAQVGFTVADEVRAAFERVLGLRVDLAEEPGGRRYAGACVRIHPDGVANPMHNDLIARDAAGTGLTVAGLAYQLSCVICLQECQGGGESKVYARTWEPADERFKIPGGLGYDHGVVAGVPALEFAPQAHDVYVLDPRHYHEILEVSGDDRLTVGFFFGGDDALEHAVAWG